MGSQDEGRNYTSELFRLKAANDEAIECLDIVKRENKNLADEIKDLLDQLGDGGRSIHDLDKQRRRLETEKEELQAALEEAEATLEMKKIRFLEHSWSLVKSDRILTDVLLKRKMNSTTPGKIMLVLWTLLEHPLRQSSVPRVRLSESRNNLREKSTGLKLVLTMQTKPMLKD